MKRLFLILTVILFCSVQTSYAKGTDKSEKVGTALAISSPVWIGIISVGSASISTPEIVAAAAIAYGAYKTHIGDWGKDGKYAIKNCVGTHINGNCAHLPLSEVGTNQTTTNFGFVGHN